MLNAAWANSGSMRSRENHPIWPPLVLADGSSETSFASVAKSAPATSFLRTSLRERERLFGLARLGVDQDLRHIDLLGHAVFALVDEIELFRLDFELFRLGVEFLAGNLLEVPQLRLGQLAIRVQCDTPLHHRVFLEAGLARIGGQRLDDQQIGEICAEPLGIARELVAHLRRNALNVGV